MSRCIMVLNGHSVVGSSVVRHLLWNEDHRRSIHKLWVTVKDISHSGDLWPLGASLIEMGDSPDESQLREYMKRINCLVLCPDFFSKNMPEQIKIVLRAAKQENVEQVLLVSRCGIEDERQNKTAQHFLEVEKCLKEAGLRNACIVRVAPLQNDIFLFRRMFEGGKLELPIPEDAKYTMINLEDVAKFVCTEIAPENMQKRAAKGGNVEMYKLTGTKILTPRHLVEQLQKNAGIQVKYVKCDRQHMERYLRDELGWNEHMARVAGDETELITKGKLDFVSDDTKKKIGEEPEKLDDFLTKHRSLFEKKGNSTRTSLF